MPPGGAYMGPPQQSGGALKVILIVVGVLLGLGLLAGALIMFAAWRVTKAVKVNQGGEGVTVSTPGGGTFSAGKSAKMPTEAELGVAIYPGASAAEGGLNFSLGGGSMITSVLSTSDSPQQVIDFYKGKLGENAAVMESSEGAVITSGKEHSDESLMITVSRDKSNDRTAITITHTKGKKSS